MHLISLGRSLVDERAVASAVVVVLLPVGDDHAGLREGPEDVYVQRIHLMVMVALCLGMRVQVLNLQVLTRGSANRDLAVRLGVDWSTKPPTSPSRRSTAPSFSLRGSLVPVARRSVDRRGRWRWPVSGFGAAGDGLRHRPVAGATAGTVNAITRQDAEGFLRLAARYQVKAETSVYPRSEANHPPCPTLAAGWFSGAAVLDG